MRIGYILGMAGCLMFNLSYAQEEKNDSLKSASLQEVVIEETSQRSKNRNSTLNTDVVNQTFLKEHFTGNLVQTLNNIPGFHSMDIGSGFSKPMIRGMGFNRISVVENGVKQEGQQWGADHGLEIDAFNVERVNIIKGSSSLQYGSDAMGGVVEILPQFPPVEDQIFGSGMVLYKSVNNTIGGSVSVGVKKGDWFTKFRYTEQHFGDYRIPADSVIYLTQCLPIYKNKMKNTAGYERDFNLYNLFKKGNYEASLFVSNTYQKSGFFPGAHGVPDVSRLADDGSSPNIELPFSRVNHLKVTSNQKYNWNDFIFYWDLGYQNNHREEMSLFHTHYGTQSPPEKDPNKELSFTLNTFSSSMKGRLIRAENWEHTMGWDIQYQENTISGYSFLLPQYNRFTTGVYWIGIYRPSSKIMLNGGVRYDYGKTDIAAFSDPYLVTYLQEQGYSPEEIDEYKWRSYDVNRNMGNFSGSLGLVWTPDLSQTIQMNVGHSYRLPSANELASNGVHHGTFRHEQGDASLSSEKGWQLDMSYTFNKSNLAFRVTPFFSWFSNYIYLKPTGEWSILPHAGQIYRYTGTEAIFAGGEMSASISFLNHLKYEINGEYVYTYNRDERTALSFSPPASLRNILTWKNNRLQINAEWQLIARQNRIAQNEEKTAGAGLFHINLSTELLLGGEKLELTLSAQNIFDKRYFNHLSFYRKVEIPEPGRNFQILIKLPLKRLLK